MLDYFYSMEMLLNKPFAIDENRLWWPWHNDDVQFKRISNEENQ